MGIDAGLEKDALRKILVIWSSVQRLPSRKYACGYCGTPLASDMGWKGTTPGGAEVYSIYICHQCHRPTFFDDYMNHQTPEVVFGNPVKDIPDSGVLRLYEEARRTTCVGAFTATVLCCRKLLMHIAVTKGAKAGGSFIDYVQFFADHNFIPPDAREWVDHIRKKSNEANHEIVLMNKEEAEEILSLIEMLLKVIFEFPAMVKRKNKAG